MAPVVDTGGPAQYDPEAHGLHVVPPAQNWPTAQGVHAASAGFPGPINKTRTAAAMAALECVAAK